MATFFTDLIKSIFTPGPTPTLLVATNASFACLQFVLLALLIATYSVHFIVLSFLCAGLWWSINWFVTELRAAQAAEEAKKEDIAKTVQKPGDGSDTDAETIVDTGSLPSKEVEVTQVTGELKARGSPGGSKSELSTEDEWEKVSEHENEKDK